MEKKLQESASILDKSRARARKVKQEFERIKKKRRFSTARKKGVHPHSLVTFMSEPFSSRYMVMSCGRYHYYSHTILVCPYLAARCSGVLPSESGVLMKSVLERKNSTYVITDSFTTILYNITSKTF